MTESEILKLRAVMAAALMAPRLADALFDGTGERHEVRSAIRRADAILEAIGIVPAPGDSR